MVPRDDYLQNFQTKTMTTKRLRMKAMRSGGPARERAAASASKVRQNTEKKMSQKAFLNTENGPEQTKTAPQTIKAAQK